MIDIRDTEKPAARVVDKALLALNRPMRSPVSDPERAAGSTSKGRIRPGETDGICKS
jgi:hypothetical protein